MAPLPYLRPGSLHRPRGPCDLWGARGFGAVCPGQHPLGLGCPLPGPRGLSQLQVPLSTHLPGPSWFRGPLWVAGVCSLLLACQSPAPTPLFSPPSFSVQLSPVSVSGFVLQTGRFLVSHLGNWCYLLKVTLELQPAGVRRSRIELKGVEIGWKQEEDLSGVISVLLVAGGRAPGFVPSPDGSLGWGGGGGRREEGGSPSPG